MKTLIKNIVLPALVLLFVCTSCQDEIDVAGPAELNEENIEATSETAALIVQTSANDGSSDNIIDGASCISIVFPITVDVNGVEITLDSEMDLRIVEEIFDEFSDDEDNLDIIFPITIMTGDFSEVVINNQQELALFVDECIEGGDDDDIECIDFQYPITFFKFNRETQEADRIEVENDRQLHRLFRDLDEGEILSIQYPVTLILFDGTEIVVNSNQELARALRDARELCDEDDDDDFNDDDFTKERLDAFLVECPWIVKEVRRSDNDQTPQYEAFLFNFRENGTVVVRDRGGNVLEGTWATRVTDNGALLRLEFDTLVDFNLEWFVYDISRNRIKLFTEGGNRIIMEQNCEANDITPERVEAFLQECFWRITRLQVDGIDFEERYIGTPFNFQENGVVTLRVNGQLINGEWDVLEANIGFVLNIVFPNRPELNLFWLISRLDEDRILLINQNSQLILKRFCENDQDGDVVEIRQFLNSGEWEVATYIDSGNDETADFDGFGIVFDLNGAVFAQGNGGVINGSWLLRRDDEGLKLDLNFEEQMPFDELNDDWKIVEVGENVIELRNVSEENDSESILVLEKRQTP